MRGIPIALPLLLLVSAPVAAGVYYEARTETATEESKGAEAYRVTAWVDGDSAKILFEESGNPMFGAGSYLVTTDGGQTVRLVNTQDETYAVFDVEAVLSTVANLDEMTGGAMGLDFRDGSSAVVSKGPGEPLLGMSTTRLEWTANYTMAMKMLGMSRETRVETVTEAWLADALDDRGFGVWLRKGPPKTGDPDLDAALAAGWQDFDGFPLKSVARTTTTGKKGKTRTSTAVTEVTQLREESVPASTFVIPESYTEVSLMPAASEEEANPLEGLFGRKGKDKS